MLNRRLIKYNLKTFDYTKVNNKHYCDRYNTRLLINYYWNEIHDVRKTIAALIKRIPNKWFKTLIELDIDDYIKNQLQIDHISAQIILLNINCKCCKRCNKLIQNKLTFCSVKCANVYKSNDKVFLDKLSNSVKQSYIAQSKEQRSSRNQKISVGVNNHNDNLSNEELQKYTNKHINYTSFANLENRFIDLIFMCNEEFYYNNKYLHVKCKKCNNEWEVTKTTNISRVECKQCNPYKKHKTQTRIFNYIKEHIYAKENDKSIISNELDIYVPSLNFAIEYNGLLNHSFGPCKLHYYNKFNIDRTYHLHKTEECELLNIQLFHIFENEFLDVNKRKIWYSIINNKLNINNRIHARLCTIKEINYNECSTFLERTHLQGSCNSSVKIGLFYNDILVSVMTFRKHKKYQWEIARFSSELNTVIVGGGSKLLKYFELNYKPKSIISYANRRWSQGNLYNKLGFTFVENTAPNYFYFKVNKNILYSREKFQKHKLSKILSTYDESLTEVQNMFNNDYRIIFDSGNKKYLKYYDF